MTSSIRWISIDSADPYPLSRFYGAVTGWATDDEDRPDHDECAVLPASGHPGLLFTRLPEGKIDELRTGRPIHLDVMPTGRSRDGEVEQLLAIGATEHRITVSLTVRAG